MRNIIKLLLHKKGSVCLNWSSVCALCVRWCQDAALLCALVSRSEVNFRPAERISQVWLKDKRMRGSRLHRLAERKGTDKEMGNAKVEGKMDTAGIFFWKLLAVKWLWKLWTVSRLLASSQKLQGVCFSFAPVFAGLKNLLSSFIVHRGGVVVQNIEVYHQSIILRCKQEDALYLLHQVALQFRQGCLLSLLLFRIFIDCCLKYIKVWTCDLQTSISVAWGKLSN